MRSFPRRKNSVDGLPLYNTDPAAGSSRLCPIRLTRSVLITLFLGFVFALSLLLNMVHYTFSLDIKHLEVYQNWHSQLPVLPALPGVHDLIIVTGHAVFVGGDIEKIGDDHEWVLEEFQKGGQVNTFVEHIKKGVELASENKDSLLIFSGFVVGGHLFSSLCAAFKFYLFIWLFCF